MCYCEDEVIDMTDYRKMYLVLCDAVSKTLDDLEGQPGVGHECFLRLKEAMNETEDIYIETSDDEEKACL